MSLSSQMIIAGIALIGGGTGYYFYRKRTPFSEATRDELERLAPDRGFKYLPEYGFVLAFAGLIFLALGIWGASKGK